MNHTTTAPMIREALADEGLSAEERAPHLRVPCGLATEILITAGEKSGRAHFDLPVSGAYGFQASEFETGEGQDGAAYVYATGMQPTKPLEQEARAMAAAVNRSVRGATGAPAAVLLAAPLVSYLDCAGMERVPEEHQERVRAIIAGGETRADESGRVLLRECADASMDLYALKTALDGLWRAYADTGALRDDELEWHDVRPYMIRAARSAVRDRWNNPRSWSGMRAGA
ncbi:hypothetical protein [Streptomyces violaceusniger]|uniref:Uncharacterized protein n=1 Tax=Streptomyces violaceusniger (strain Tu 4113) TaxID=653045 RepID=G2PHQ4_STRV4|nr:hypothetical protein [Streptomyces violaceusniger]AEM88855.1 hypothetical protein Strvi_0079 [Streptomyces violaceusniger Tu 4113]